MPNPIPFSVAPAQRSGTFFAPASPIAYPGGYSRIYWELDIPQAADYENVANEVDSFLLVNGADSESVWVGGARVDKLGNPDPAPAFEYDLRNVQAGDTLQVKITVVRGMKIGVKNGVIA